MPWIAARAGEDQPVVGQFAGTAHLGEDLAQPVTRLGGAGRPVRDQHPAAGHQRRRQERLRVGQVRLDRQVPAEQRARRDPPHVRLAARLRGVHLGADRAQHVHRHPDVRQRGQRRADVADLHALVEARRRQQQALHELRRRRRRRSSTGPPSSAPAAVHGQRQRAAAVVVDPGAERRAARRSRRAADARTDRGSPSKRTGPSASAATGGRKRITVPALPTSTVAGPCRPAGMTRQASPRVGPPAWSWTTPSPRSDAHRAQGAGHQQGVPGAQRAAQPAGLGGEGGEHQGAVGDRLGPRHVDRRVDGSARVRGGPEGGVCGVRGHGPHFKWRFARTGSGRGVRVVCRHAGAPWTRSRPAADRARAPAVPRRAARPAASAAAADQRAQGHRVEEEQPQRPPVRGSAGTAGRRPSRPRRPCAAWPGARRPGGRRRAAGTTPRRTRTPPGPGARPARTPAGRCRR